MRDFLKKKIEDFMLDNDLNTYKIRKMRDNGEENPMNGVGISTILKIRLDPNYIPSRSTIKKLLELFNVEYKEDYTGIKIINDGL